MTKGAEALLPHGHRRTLSRPVWQCLTYLFDCLSCVQGCWQRQKINKATTIENIVTKLPYGFLRDTDFRTRGICTFPTRTLSACACRQLPVHVSACQRGWNKAACGQVKRNFTSAPLLTNSIMRGPDFFGAFDYLSANFGANEPKRFAAFGRLLQLL